jgi:hypothetical protein
MALSLKKKSDKGGAEKAPPKSPTKKNAAAKKDLPPAHSAEYKALVLRGEIEE